MNQLSLSLVRVGCILTLFLILGGCGPATVKLVPVSGKITIQSAPLPWGNITLVPAATKGNSSQVQPLGTVAADGTYSISTDGRPGAPLGAYIVTIAAVQPSPVGEYKPPVWAASQDYLDKNKSGLTLTVVESPAAGAYDIVLTKK